VIDHGQETGKERSKLLLAISRTTYAYPLF